MDFPELFGGAACLDFANSLDGRATPTPQEHLTSYAELVRWGEFAGLIAPVPAPVAFSGAAQDAALGAALGVREAIFRVFLAIGRGEPAAAADLALVQDGFAAAMAGARLVPVDGGHDWRFAEDDPDRAWWPAAVSAVDVLTRGPLDRVKVCAAEAGCIGLFLDTSKNRSRRWCTMAGCGVEAKVQRQATRRRSRPSRR